MPTCTGAFVTAAEPVAPLIGVGPAALSVQSVGTALAPVVPLSTTLTRVSVGATAWLVMVQTTVPCTGSVTREPVDDPALADPAPGREPGRTRLGQVVAAGQDGDRVDAAG